jgi:hypothetical protein
LRPQELPKVKPKNEPPSPGAVLDEVTTFVRLALTWAVHLISTNDRISVEEPTATETTFAFRTVEGDGRGGEPGRPSIDRAASGLSVSTRTLQGRLTEYETTWRAEVDSARQRRTDQSSATNAHQLAARLGYADPRSVRRARRRWKAVRTEDEAEHALVLNDRFRTCEGRGPASDRRPTIGCHVGEPDEP